MKKEESQEKEQKDPSNKAEGEHSNEETASNQENEVKESVEDQTAQETPQEGEEQLEQLKKELEESKDKYLRLYSDFENFRRRTAKEKIETIQSANRDLMVALLPVADDFERAAKSIGDDPKDVKPVKDGFDIIFKKFVKTLQDQGLQEMEDPKGKEFDMELHEAITQIPAPSEDMKGKVVDVVEKGYILGEKVIRYARVVVGA